MDKIQLITIFFLLVLVVTGCVPVSVDTSEEAAAIAEQYVGNALPIVDLKTLVEANKLVPQSKNKAYTLDNRVGIEGEYYIFNIYTPHGTVLAKGMAALVARCYESEVLEMLLSSNFGIVLQSAMAENVDYSNNEVVDSKVYNIDSIAGIGRRFNQKYSEDFDRDVIVDNILDRNICCGSYYDLRRMTLAYKLGLDAYSANTFVQAFLDSLLMLSPEDLGGLDEVDLLQPEINITRGRKNIDASVQSRYLFPGSRNLLLEARIVNSDPATIKVKLQQLYQPLLAGVVDLENSVKALLDSAKYSIRQQLYIFAYLNDMKSVSGKNDIVSLMASASSSFEATQYYLQLQLLHAYYVAGGLKRFVAFSNLLGAVDSAGQIIVIPTWDHTRERGEVRKLLVEVRNLKQKISAGAASIWFVGDCDKNTEKTARKAGISIRSGVVSDSIFRFTDFRRLTYRFVKGDPLVKNAATLTPDPIIMYPRVNRPVPTQLLADSENPAKKVLAQKSTIKIEEPDKPKPTKHDPRNWREFGIGVKIIPKEELQGSGVPGIAEQGVGHELDFDETGSGAGKLPVRGDDPVKVKSSGLF